LRACNFRFWNVVAIGFVDGDSVCHFHDAALDTLQFVAGIGELNE
jgi:hypothetical protein